MGYWPSSILTRFCRLLTPIIVVSSFAILFAVQAGGGTPPKPVSQLTWGSVSKGLVMSIQSSESPYKSNGPINLAIRIKNVSGQDITINRLSWVMEYSFEVRAPDRSLVAMRTDPNAPAAWSNPSVWLKPGAIYCVDIDLSRVYALSGSGTYSVRAKTAIALQGVRPTAYTTLTSNTAEVTITPN
jgi:hypothetical protein